MHLSHKRYGFILMHKQNSSEKKKGEGNSLSDELLPHARCKTPAHSFERKWLLCPQMWDGRRNRGGVQNAVAPSSCRAGCIAEGQIISDQLADASPLPPTKAAAANWLASTRRSSTGRAGAAQQLWEVCKEPFAPKKWWLSAMATAHIVLLWECHLRTQVYRSWAPGTCCHRARVSSSAGVLMRLTAEG